MSRPDAYLERDGEKIPLELAPGGTSVDGMEQWTCGSSLIKGDRLAMRGVFDGLSIQFANGGRVVSPPGSSKVFLLNVPGTMTLSQDDGSFG